MPEAPSHLTATASGTQIYLDWDPASGAEGYQLERSLNGTTGWQVLDDKLTKTDYVNVGLTADTRYYYRVRAYNNAGNSSYSNTVNVITDKPALAAPAGLRATPTTSTEISLAWTAVSGADGYSIERSTNGTSGWTEIANNIVADSYRDRSLTVVGTYYYRIRAFRGNAYSEYSNIASTTTAVTIPATPTGLRVTAVSSSELLLSWTAVSGVTYSIERRVSGGAAFAVIAPEVATDSYRDTGLSSSAEYTYRIRAHNGAGYSEYSAEVTGRTGGYDLTALNNRITWDNTTKRYALTNSPAAPGLHFKFGSVVGNMVTPIAWSLTQNVLWSPVTITNWASIPFYAESDYPKTITRADGYHTIDNVKAGKGDPCRLVGLDLEKIKDTNANSLTNSDIDNGTWRLPTNDENEAFSGYTGTTNTTVHWTMTESINGGIFPNTTSGSNKFLPASGYRDGEGTRQKWAEGGAYWASAPMSPGSKYGHVLSFTASMVGFQTMDSPGFAASVRCVRQ
ncbi:MAG: fibronectin type III domain-containing protein [Tannerellaceae bacterium]|nr:fibronectin type III domain-containing protein [Tannerellaceae bacterium]